MNTDDMFRVMFWTLLGSMLLTRGWFGFRVWRTGERVLPDRTARQREGLWPQAIEGVFHLLLAALIVRVGSSAAVSGHSLFPRRPGCTGRASPWASRASGCLRGPTRPSGGSGPPRCSFAPATG